MHTSPRPWPRLFAGGLLVGLLFWGASGSWSRTPEPRKSSPVPPDQPARTLEQSFKKARCNGRYSMLLRQIRVERDQAAPGAFAETGYDRKSRYAGHDNLPAGYWVYVDPYWYIFRDINGVANPRRTWGPEQAAGPPDTDGVGDFGTAWASLTPDGQDEWLMLEYPEPVVPKAVRVHENWNPGAVRRVTVFSMDGQEVDAWEGTDPTPADQPRGVSEIPLTVDFKTNRVRLHLASRAYRGWNEIDAVALVDTNGKTQWAAAAEASSTAANGNEQTMFMALLTTERRVRQMELELQALRAIVQRQGKPAAPPAEDDEE